MSNRPPKTTLQRLRSGRGRVQPDEYSARQGSKPGAAKGAAVDLRPLGGAPKGVPPRVRYWWRATAKDLPQLSQRDRHAVLDYCRKMVEHEELIAIVEAEGRFVERDGVRVRSVEYTALLEAEKALHRMRKDFAALAGHRARAKALPGAAGAGESGDGGERVLSPMARLLAESGKLSVVQ